MRRKNSKAYLFLAICLLLLLGSATAVSASSDVPAGRGAVSIKASKPGWKKINGYWYYYGQNKRLQQGWLKLNNKWFYLASNGRMARGMKSIGNKKYYFNTGQGSSEGVMYAQKWKKVQSKWYYFGESGAALKSEWLKYKNKWYYLSSNCIMATGWKNIGGKRYYLYPGDGHMAANKWIGNSWVGADGAMTPKSWRNGSGSKRVYSSATLNIEITQKNKYNTKYWIARVKTSKGSQLKSELSYGSYGGTRERTSSAIKRKGGIIGINGSAFSYSTGKPSPLGMCIKNGKVYGNYATSYTVMAVKKNGTIFTPRQGLWAQSLLNMGVKDTYNFGPILINNGIAQPAIAETNKYYPRVAVGMISKNDYVLLCCDGRRVNGSVGLNHWQMLAEFQALKCKYAYNLDGGGSATLYYNGSVLNHPSDGAERPCADFLYFTR